MQTHLYNLFISFLSILILSSNSFAGPVVEFCIYENCKKTLHVKITDNSWSKVKELYASPFATDKDEQDNIANSIALMESDIYKTLASKNTETLKAEKLYKDNSSKNNYKNIKSYLDILLDTYLVKRHIMRKTVTQFGWAGYRVNGLLLQSLSDSQIYILKIDPQILGESPDITTYKSKTIFGINYDFTADDMDNAE